MSAARTSHTHPLQIAEVAASNGLIGITFCPGKQDRFAHTGAWARDLTMDLGVIQQWGATLILTLTEQQELRALGVKDLGSSVHQLGMAWIHLPIADFSTPTAAAEEQWQRDGRLIRQRLRRGERILVHCKGGLGRAGMMAARLLVELGAAPDDAIRSVRAARKGAIETPSQLALVKQTRPLHDD